jgi:hypothetical protein
MEEHMQVYPSFKKAAKILKREYGNIEIMLTQREFSWLKEHLGDELNWPKKQVEGP